MFEQISATFSNVLGSLTGRGRLTEADVTAALKEIRRALLEADVSLEVAREFVGNVKGRAIGHEVLRAVNPGQQVVKIVHDALVEALGAEDASLNLLQTPPVPILMVGLQGAGKTTTAAKLAKVLNEGLHGMRKASVLVASLDVRRPAAQEQLAILAEQAGVASLPIVAGEDPEAIARRAMEVARLRGFDVVVLDTAGRLSIDDDLMAEATRIREISNPAEVLLVADAMTGQDAVTVAAKFREAVGVTGVILSRMDGDSRGGAALAMRAVSGAPIKFVGLGEQLDALEPFHPDRMAGRILGMGDIVSLVEKAQAASNEDEEARLNARLMKGQFDMNDLLDQFRKVQKMGGLGDVLGMMPGMGKLKGATLPEHDPKMLKRQEAIVLSMTRKERRDPDLLKASRKRRIAAGAGVEVQDVNRLFKQWQQMNGLARHMKNTDGSGLANKLAGALGGGMPGMPGGLSGGMPKLAGGKVGKRKVRLK